MNNGTTTLTPILSFPKAFNEPDESHAWEADDSCSKFWNLFLEEQKEVEQYDFLADDVIVKHWFYCAACTPATEIISDKREFLIEIASARVGDIFEIWTLSDTPKYFVFKCPDERGYAPQKGAY